MPNVALTHRFDFTVVSVIRRRACDDYSGWVEFFLFATLSRHTHKLEVKRVARSVYLQVINLAQNIKGGELDSLPFTFTDGF